MLRYLRSLTRGILAILWRSRACVSLQRTLKTRLRFQGPGFPAFSSVLISQAGQAFIIFPSAILVSTSLVFFLTNDVFNSQSSIRRKTIHTYLLETTVHSSFAVMEAALRRRMWEAPPDTLCLKSPKFSVSGETSGGVRWRVDADYDFNLNVISLLASGEDKFGNKAKFVKQIKIMDTSDYLFVSTTKQAPVSFSRSQIAPTSMIAGKRRVYVASPVEITGAYSPRNSNDYSTNPAGHHFARDYGIILQGERIQFARGLRYAMGSEFRTPNDKKADGTEDLIGKSVDQLYKSQALYDVRSQAPNTSMFGLAPTSPTIFFGGNQLDLARLLRDRIRFNNGTPNSELLSAAASIYAQTFPVSLSASRGQRPYLAWLASDNGTYDNFVPAWQIPMYTSGNNFLWTGMNATCFARDVLVGGRAERRYCNYTEAEDPDSGSGKADEGAYPWYRIRGFPEGFKKWRKDAGLESTLKTYDSEVLRTVDLDWDHLDALRDDARKCGLYVPKENNLAKFSDCQVWDRQFLDLYRKKGDSPTCMQYSQIRPDDSLNSLPLQNFDPNTELSAPTERLLRRVVFSEGSMEIHQARAQGIWGGLVDSDLRSRLSIWFVSPEILQLRTYQTPDEPGVIDTVEKSPNFSTGLSPSEAAEANRIRKVSFNRDVSGAAQPLPALNLTLLSPEKVHVVSPQYKALTRERFLEMYPLVDLGIDGRHIQPRRYNVTDYHRYEEDAYIYGIRDVDLNNLAIITNGDNMAETSEVFETIGGAKLLFAQREGRRFFLKGLWDMNLYNEENRMGRCMMWSEQNQFPRADHNEDGLIDSKDLDFNMDGITDNREINVNSMNYENLDDSGQLIPPLGSRFYRQKDYSSTAIRVSYVNGQYGNLGPALNANFLGPSLLPLAPTLNYNFLPKSVGPRAVPAAPPEAFPWAFVLQRHRWGGIDGARTPILTHTGISLGLKFLPPNEYAKSLGLKDLSKRQFDTIRRYRMDLSQKKFVNERGNYYQVQSLPQSCSVGIRTSNLIFDNASKQRMERFLLVNVNNGGSLEISETPETSFTGLGSLAGVEMPTVQVSSK